jgi:alanyl-tRNA synthetase
LRDTLQGRSGVVALLAAAEPERGRLAFCAGPGTEVDVRPALRAALAVLGGRGGGRPERAQGAGPAVDAVEAALDAALDALRAGR